MSVLDQGWTKVKSYDSGKYTLESRETPNGLEFRAKRYGDHWQTFTGNHFLNLCFTDVRTLAEADHEAEMKWRDSIEAPDV